MGNRFFDICTFLSALFFCSSPAVYSGTLDAELVKQQAFKVASQYAQSISCDTSIEENNLLALVPWESLYDLNERENAEYVLIWNGDIGCYGGSGSIHPNIATIKIRAGNTYVVDPLQSSPFMKLNIQFHGITEVIKYSKDSIFLGAMDWGPDDGHCCPSKPVEILLERDSEGNWKHTKTVKK